jgi:hypothetical protein
VRCLVILSALCSLLGFFFCLARVEPSPLVLRPFVGLLYHPWMTDNDNCGAVAGMNEW